MLGILDGESSNDTVEIDDSEWENVTTTGVSGPTMAIIPGYFGISDRFKQYYFMLTARKSRTNITGKAYYISDKKKHNHLDIKNEVHHKSSVGSSLKVISNSAINIYPIRYFFN